MLMNAEQAAKVLDCDPGWFRRLAKRGEVAGVFKIGRNWAAEYDAWKAAAEAERKPGPKRRRG